MKQQMAKQVSRSALPWYRWLKWGDWLLYGLIGSLALVLLLLAPGRSGNASARAVLSHRGEVILVVTAEQLQAGGSVEIDVDGYHYDVVYADGRIRFGEADCPDRICVRTGWISRSGQIAACVPGHLIMRIEGTESLPTDPDDVDVIVG